MERRLFEKLKATYEVCAGRELSTNATKLVVASLDRYEPKAVSDALDVCIMECKGFLTPADIISRVVQQDGRLSPDEAWAELPKDEHSSGCMTEEMSYAFGVCGGLIGRDNVAARMAFISAYKKRVQEARSAGRPVKWHVSLGLSEGGRESCVRRALDEGKITDKRAKFLAPTMDLHSLPEPKQARRLHGKMGRASEHLNEVIDTLTGD